MIDSTYSVSIDGHLVYEAPKRVQCDLFIVALHEHAQRTLAPVREVLVELVHDDTPLWWAHELVAA